jgi:hypothetical protein
MSLKYDAELRLTEADPKPMGQRVPNPLHERIEELCDLVYAKKYGRPTKMRMLAALLLGAPTDATVLQEMLLAYDAATVAECPAIPERGKGEVVEYPERKSGPRGPHS